MRKLQVQLLQFELDLRNERADNNNHILFYKDSKQQFGILCTKENQFKTVSGSVPIKIRVTASTVQLKNLLDNK